MDKISILCKIIQNVLDIPTNIILKNTQQFDWSIIKEKNIYESESDDGTKFAIFIFEQTKIIVGPFVTSSWDENKKKDYYIKNSDSIEFITQYKLFYTRCTLTTSELIKKVINAAIVSLCPNESKFIYLPIRKTKARLFEELPFHALNEFEYTVQLYNFENHLLEMVSTGQVDQVLIAKNNLYKLHKKNFNSNYYIYDYSIEGARSGSYGLRALIRKAAEKGGLHPAIINSITQSYVQRINASNSMVEIEGLGNELIVELTTEVHKILTENYSYNTRQTIDYININFKHNLTLELLANNIGISTGHLTRQFKKEVGSTIFDFIKEKRFKEAKVLLLNTNLPIQYISEYVGYSDNNYFSKLFKDTFNVTPSEFRKEQD